MKLKWAAAAAIIGLTFCGHAVQAQASTFQTIYTFKSSRAGSRPTSTLVRYGSDLIGTTEFGGSHKQAGTIFSINPHTSKFKVLHRFTDNPDGAGPSGQMVVIGQSLYGTTSLGGANDSGAIYKLDLSSNIETTFLSLSYSSGVGRGPDLGLVQFHDALYGLSIGGSGAIIFKAPLDGRPARAEYDFGPEIFSSLYLKVGSKLWGVSYGGQSRLDIISFSPSDRSLTTVYTKNTGCCDYVNRLTIHQGVLYGAASGSVVKHQWGSIFSIDPVTGVEKDIYKFRGQPDGAIPSSELTYFQGMFYGVTEFGGTAGEGSIYRFDPVSGAVAVVYSFTGGADGETPNTGLVAVGNALYGTTYEALQYGNGTIFKFTP